jgi:uncharacterized membrane protein YcaP (DUF421 family)
MFDLTVPWWELVARGATIYLFLLVLVRLSGKRTIGQFTPFDLLVVMLLSEGVSNGLLGGEESLLGALIAACTLVGLNNLVSRISARSPKLRVLVEGEPVLVGRDGKILVKRLLHEHLTEEDLLQALREADCNLEDMRYVFLEADGQFSVLQHAKPEGSAARNQ